MLGQLPRFASGKRNELQRCAFAAQRERLDGNTFVFFQVAGHEYIIFLKCFQELNQLAALFGGEMAEHFTGEFAFTEMP